MKKILLAVITIMAVSAALLFSGCGSSSPFSNKTPFEIYQTVSGKAASLSSIEYSAEQESKIDFAKDDQRKTLTDISVSEIYHDDTMESHMHASYRGNTSVTEYNEYFKDDTIYSDMTGIKIKEKSSLKKYISGNIAITNPLIFMKGNSLFSIPEKEIRSITFEEADSESDSNVLSITLKNTAAADYLKLSFGKENSIYTNRITASDFTFELEIDDDYMPSHITIRSDISVSTGKGYILWNYTIISADKLENIDYPDLKKYR